MTMWKAAQDRGFEYVGGVTHEGTGCQPQFMGVVIGKGGGISLRICDRPMNEPHLQKKHCGWMKPSEAEKLGKLLIQAAESSMDADF